MHYDRWTPYISVSERRENAKKQMKALQRTGKIIQPVEITGNKIAKSFWGKAWCEHLEQFSDYANRLPRGRTYARNGSVCHLEIKKGKVEAIVSGSSLYEVNAIIKPLSKQHWKNIKRDCSGKISSILDLLQGKLSSGVMKVVIDRNKGILPQPKQINLSCSCPDWADMCKHIAAVLYGVGARLDASPEMLFLLRGVDHQELVNAEINLPEKSTNKPKIIGDLSSIFGVEIDESIAFSKPKRTEKPTKKARLRKGSVKEPAVASTTQKKPRKKRAFSITAKGIVRMRKKFAMNYAQYACLVGVSPGTIKNWEGKEGKLNLKPEKLVSLERIATIDKATAWSVYAKNKR